MKEDLVTVKQANSQLLDEVKLLKSQNINLRNEVNHH